MLQPKKTKYRRVQHGVQKGFATRGNQLAFGSFGIKCLQYKWLNGRQIEAARTLLLLPPIPPRIRVFSNESTLRMRWPKYGSFSFSISPSNEHPGLVSFGWTGWISLQCKGLSQESSPTMQFKSINSSALSFLHSPTLTSIHDHRKNYSLD